MLYFKTATLTALVVVGIAIDFALNIYPVLVSHQLVDLPPTAIWRRGMAVSRSVVKKVLSIEQEEDLSRTRMTVRRVGAARCHLSDGEGEAIADEGGKVSYVGAGQRATCTGSLLEVRILEVKNKLLVREGVDLIDMGDCVANCGRPVGSRCGAGKKRESRQDSAGECKRLHDDEENRQ